MTFVELKNNFSFYVKQIPFQGKKIAGLFQVLGILTVPLANRYAERTLLLALFQPKLHACPSTT